MRKYLLFIIFLIIFSQCAFSQCPVTASAWPSTIYCGDSVTLSAIHSTVQPIISDFNDGKIDDKLKVTSNGVVVDSTDTIYDCFGHPPEGSHYLFMSSASDTPRYVETVPLDLIKEEPTGGTICFFMKYGTQNGNGDLHDMCEGIENISEGIYLEYNTGGGWVTMNYWNPNTTGDPVGGGHDSLLTIWCRYCMKLPVESITGSTKFRLIQKNCDGPGYDTWGIDDITVVMDVDGYKYDWTHDQLPPSDSSGTPKVAPSRNTTYTVNYSNGSKSCSDEVDVTVLEPVDMKHADPDCMYSYLYVPVAFTPNGDGLNDVFLPVALSVHEYEMEIYDRWGTVVFYTRNHLEGWTGEAPSGVYSYTITIKNIDGVTRYYMDKVVLIR